MSTPAIAASERYSFGIEILRSRVRIAVNTSASAMRTICRLKNRLSSSTVNVTGFRTVRIAAIDRKTSPVRTFMPLIHSHAGPHGDDLERPHAEPPIQRVNARFPGGRARTIFEQPSQLGKLVDVYRRDHGARRNRLEAADDFRDPILIRRGDENNDLFERTAAAFERFEEPGEPAAGARRRMPDVAVNSFL